MRRVELRGRFQGLFTLHVVLHEVFEMAIPTGD